MKACIICYGFSQNNIRLQPWRYFSEIAKGLIQEGIEVTVITDGAAGVKSVDGISVLALDRLRSLPGGKNYKLIAAIRSQKPDVILWSISPLDYLYLSTLRLARVPVIGVITCPLYRFSEISRLGVGEIVKNYPLLSLHILQSVLPDFFIRETVNSGCFSRVIVMSGKNQSILERAGCAAGKIVHVPAGIRGHDLDMPPHRESVVSSYGLSASKFNLLYFGSPATLRGIDSLLRAVAKLKAEARDVRLIVLSRRREGELGREESGVRELAKQLDIEGEVKIISGFLGEDDIKRFILFCDLVALPFKIVPSDVPTSILEAMAMGKTVVSTSIDGIPEILCSGRGLLAKPADGADLYRIISQCIGDEAILRRINEKARTFMLGYPRWNDVARMVKGIILESMAADTGSAYSEKSYAYLYNRH